MTNSKNAGNSVDAQRARLLEALRSGPLSTLDIRRRLDILMPGARILELRQRGHNITTTRVDETTDAGHLHRVAKYALLPSSQTDLFAAPSPDEQSH